MTDTGHCGPCANVVDVTTSVTVTNCDNDTAFLTRELTTMIAPRIQDIISAMHRGSFSLIGLPSLINIHLESAEDAAYYHQADEARGAAEAAQRQRESVELTETLLGLCRPPEQSRSKTRSREEWESDLTVAFISVLRKLDMEYAVECLQRYLHAWQKMDDSVLCVSDFFSDAGSLVPRSHRIVLEESFASIVDNLTVSEALISILLKKSIISDQMAYLVLGRPNRKQQVVQLIQLLMQLGPYALQVFMEALRATGNTPLANILAWNLRHAPRVTKESDTEG